MKNIRTVAIIGMGPRGGYALENFVLELKNNKSFSRIFLLLFEGTGNFGNGQVYDLGQSQTNWINISERALLLEKREVIDFEKITISSFPSYHEWIDRDFEALSEEVADSYPPRAKIGEYLKQRFQSLVNPLVKANLVSLCREEVERVDLINKNKIQITTDVDTYDDIDEVLLTIGHQPIVLSKQISEWDEFSANKENVTLFKSPYPIAEYLNSESLNHKSIIGIRGFGLAMIDVVRGIAYEFGHFIPTDETTKSCTYNAYNNSSYLFVPFSLNGLPPSPKPLNAHIDNWFKPTKEQILNFEKEIGNKQTQQEAADPSFLINAFTSVAAKIYLELPQSNLEGNLSINELREIIGKWLQNNEYEHPTITPIKQSAKETMEDSVEMAIGRKAISLDYCIGQVWRHCQPSIYKKLSFNECTEEVFAEIIELDESTKRYSYGPPVESIQQLLALIEVNILSLEMINDPEIKLTDNGWSFQSEGKTITANIMIDSVLDAPKIKSVNSPIVKSMVSNDLIEAVHDELGVSTDENGYVISKNINKEIPIALLGRLAKGTIIGVDAILECFGTRSHKWAIQAAKKHSNWLRKL